MKKKNKQNTTNLLRCILQCEIVSSFGLFAKQMKIHLKGNQNHRISKDTTEIRLKNSEIHKNGFKSSMGEFRNCMN